MTTVQEPASPTVSGGRHRRPRRDQAVPGRDRQPRRQHHHQAGHGARPDRRERCRQVDADEDPLRRAEARRGHRSPSTARWCSFASPTDAIKVGIGMVFQHFMLADNLTVAGERRRSVRRTCSASATGRAPRSPGSPTPSASASTPTSWSRTSASAHGSGWRSSRCSTAGRRSSSSTSRPPCWCRRRWTRCSPTCASCAPPATPSCSSPTSSTRCSPSPTTSPSCAGAPRSGRPTRRPPPSTQLAELMVGSELPSPETEESTVTDTPLLQLAGVNVIDETRSRTCCATSPSSSTRARCSASPASRATASPSWSRPSWACSRDRARSPLGDTSMGGWPTRERREAGIALHPRGPAPSRAAARRPALGEPHPGPPDPASREQGRVLIDRRGRQGRHRADRARSTTSARRRSTRAPGPCPAATSRS